MRKTLFCLLAAGLLISAAGCTHGSYSGDLKDVELVRALAVDADAAGLKACALLLNRDKALEEQYSASYYSLSAAGDDLAAAVGGLYRYGARQLNFSHCGLLLLGERAADCSGWLDYALRPAAGLRPTVYPVICEGEARALLEGGEEDTISPAYLLGNILEPQGSGRPGAAGVDLQSFVEGLLQPGLAPALPVVRAGRERGGVEMAGFAVYAEGRPCALLTGEAAEGWLWLLRSNYLAGTALSLPEANAAVQVEAAHTSARVYPQEGQTQVVWRLKLRARLLANNDALPADELERRTVLRLRELFAAAAEQSRELGLDFLGAGREIYRREPALWQEISETDYLRGLALSLQAEVQIID